MFLTINLMFWKWASASFERLGKTLEKTNCFFSPLSVFFSPSHCVCVKAQDIFFEIPRPCCITTGHLYSLEPKVESVTVKTVRREKEKKNDLALRVFWLLRFDRHCGNNIASHGSPLGVVWWLSDLESYCMPAGAYAPGRNTHAGQVIGWRSDRCGSPHPEVEWVGVGLTPLPVKRPSYESISDN